MRVPSKYKVTKAIINIKISNIELFRNYTYSYMTTMVNLTIATIYK